MVIRTVASYKSILLWTKVMDRCTGSTTHVDFSHISLLIDGVSWEVAHQCAIVCQIFYRTTSVWVFICRKKDSPNTIKTFRCTSCSLTKKWAQTCKQCVCDNWKLLSAPVSEARRELYTDKEFLEREEHW